MDVLRGDHDYRLLRKLGGGGQGAVYEAEDLTAGTRVAVKVLHAPHLAALARFKREFRTRERVRHPSLVEFGELACWQATWFFTMSLVRGVSIIDHLARQPRAGAQLRACFAQLAASVSALHGAGLIHRDIKPDNVLVEASGRVVLVDLGLVSDVDPKHSTQLIGTPAYMAPELWAGVKPSVESDWYAFGALLFEALCATPPFAGSHLDVFLAKTYKPPPRAATLTPSAPPDLCSLCDGLLRVERSERFGSAEVMSLLVDEWPGAFSDSGARPPEAELELVGRESELRELEGELEKRRLDKRGRLWFVQGASGIGKSVLLRGFAQSATRAGAWLLSGRCYEAESIPFNAFDEALDALARVLHGLSADELDAYRPRHASWLVRVFPMLSRLDSGGGSESIDPADPVEMRRLGVRALAELLARMAEKKPVVLCLDDFQWADADSVELLATLAQSDCALLLVVAIQADAAAGQTARLSASRTLQLGPLSPGTTRQLAERLLEGSHALSAPDLEQLHKQTGGSPYFVSEWARFAKDHGITLRLSLVELLAARIAAVSDVQRRLLMTVAIHGEPIELSLACRVAGADPMTDVQALRQPRLIRSFARDNVAHGDVYHNRVREVACSSLAADERAALHARIAAELERIDAPAERRVAHHIAAGDRNTAATLALRSARAAEENLAFARAAELYDLTLTLLEASDERALTLTIQKARAWQFALRPHFSGESLYAASLQCRQPARARELLRLASEQLLLAGDVSAGLAALEQALYDHGLVLPASNEEAMAEAFRWYARLRAFGLAPAAHTQLDPRQESRIALCLSIARCLHHVDLRGIPFAIRGLLEALEAGETALLQQAYAVFVMVTASHMPNPLVERALEHCRERTSRGSEPFAQALCQIAIAEAEHFRGHYAPAERACERAERTLLTSCVGISRELGQVRALALIMWHSSRGDFRTHFVQALEWLEDADRRGDAFHGNWLRAACSLAFMARDEPDRARLELARAEQAWPAARGGTFETACVLYLDALDRYEDGSSVHLRAAQARASVLGSIVAQTPLLQGYLHLQRAWGCLRELGVDRAPRRLAPQETKLLHDTAQAAIFGMRQLELPLWSATADAFEANWLHLTGAHPDRVDALLERAHDTLADAQLLALAACARHRRGELAGGELGGRWLAESDTQLEQLGVRAPQRFARAYFSPFEP